MAPAPYHSWLDLSGQPEWCGCLLCSPLLQSTPALLSIPQKPQASLRSILVPTLPSACNLVPDNTCDCLCPTFHVSSQCHLHREASLLSDQRSHTPPSLPITPRISVSSDHLSLLGKVCVFSLSHTIPCEFLWLCCCTEGVVDRYFSVDFDGVWRMLMTKYLGTNFLQ